MEPSVLNDRMHHENREVIFHPIDENPKDF